MTQNCFFCNCVIDMKKTNGYIIYEDEQIFAYLAPTKKYTYGHYLVIPKQHYEKFHELPSTILKNIEILIQKLIDTIGFTYYDILQNNGKIANQDVPHVHFHIVPKNDLLNGIPIQKNKLIEKLNLIEENDTTFIFSCSGNLAINKYYVIIPKQKYLPFIDIKNFIVKINYLNYNFLHTTNNNNFYIIPKSHCDNGLIIITSNNKQCLLTNEQRKLLAFNIQQKIINL